MAVSHPNAAQNVQLAYSTGSTVITGSKGATTLNMSSIGGMLRPTGTTSTAGNSSSTWDASGNLLKDADASGGTSEYSYDDAGRPVRATVRSASGTSISTIRYADATSLRPSMIASPRLIQSFQRTTRTVIRLGLRRDTDYRPDRLASAFDTAGKGGRRDDGVRDNLLTRLTDSRSFSRWRTERSPDNGKSRATQRLMPLRSSR